jgi:hypothetical protein
LLARHSFQLGRPVLGPLACPGIAVSVAEAEVPFRPHKILPGFVVSVVPVVQAVQAVQERLLMDLAVSP